MWVSLAPIGRSASHFQLTSTPSKPTIQSNVTLNETVGHYFTVVLIANFTVHTLYFIRGVGAVTTSSAGQLGHGRHSPMGGILTSST